MCNNDGILRICGIICLSSMLLWCGCQASVRAGKFTEEQMAQYDIPVRDDFSIPEGGFVLSIGTDTITADEILKPLMSRLEKLAGRSFESFQMSAQPYINDAVIVRVTDILFYREARKKAPASIDDALDKAVEIEVNRFVARYGSDYAKAQAEVEKMGMDWQGFREHQKRRLLTQHYLSQELVEDKIISHAELLDLYNQMQQPDFNWDTVMMIRPEEFRQKGEVEFRLIDIDISKVEPADGLSAEETAKKLAQDLLEKINAGQDFGEIAEKYSHGRKASSGGLWRPVSADSGLVAPYDTILQQARSMQDGQVTGPVKSGEHYFIIKVERNVEQWVKSFEDMQILLEDEIRYQRRRVQYSDLIERFLSKAYIANMDRFIKYCVSQAYDRVNLKQGSVFQ